nr:ADP-ribose pyrophosphatase, mitochondrial isoform X3 [Vespula vulgaris]
MKQVHVTHMYGRCIKMIHQKCRLGFYPHSKIKRFEVQESKVSWNIEYPEYEPIKYTAPSIQNKPWADPEIGSASFVPKWNAIDGKIDRKSYMGEYVINEDGYPLNPVGRTGIVGRGVLGRWGPNHAADPIVTRWKRDSNDALEINKTTNKPILQFVAIQRRDCKEWAIPGENDIAKRNEMETNMNLFFTNGIEIYKGYVDDPRNTDNAWIETVALNFHDEDNNTFGQLPLTAGDDACNVRWMDADAKLNLYASHLEFIKKTVEKHDAHW